MSMSTPLLDTIEQDEPFPRGNIPSSGAPAAPRAPVVLTPTARANSNSAPMASNEGDAESGIAGIFRQSAHPVPLFFLFAFRVAALSIYIISGYFADFVLSTVLVVVLLAMDFWNCRNVAGRTLVGLRFWNQVDEDGESYWVFESRDPSRPANPVDSKMFWIAVYSFPVAWIVILILALVRLSFSSVPIIVLALIFNFANAIGFTYADRDAKQRWASGIVSSNWSLPGLGGIGGQLLTGAVKNGVGRVFSS
ncbi:hypothetical protein BDV98DRAFT_559817 [Pterulicium gracile]|uniref:Golgi apparatus membrane protein TVP23 n=1 Tax=Pterulicium gracile TaxID=1884261 RepID=A0A5C3QXQ6_9AGAR|nr:hypothetical protein BDV98DRAFT_559817 [Pterula gracilis]